MMVFLNVGRIVDDPRYSSNLTFGSLATTSKARNADVFWVSSSSRFASNSVCILCSNLENSSAFRHAFTQRAVDHNVTCTLSSISVTWSRPAVTKSSFESDHPSTRKARVHLVRWSGNFGGHGKAAAHSSSSASLPHAQLTLLMQLCLVGIWARITGPDHSSITRSLIHPLPLVQPGLNAEIDTQWIGRLTDQGQPPV